MCFYNLLGFIPHRHIYHQLLDSAFRKLSFVLQGCEDMNHFSSILPWNINYNNVKVMLGAKGKVMKRIWLPQAIASGMLLWALHPGNPYGYYTLLHWVCCGILIYLAYQAVKLKRQIWVWILGITALVYNPIFRLHLGELWFAINIITIGIVVVSIFTLKIRDKQWSWSRNDDLIEKGLRYSSKQ